MKKWYKFLVLTVVVMFSFMLMSIQAFAATTNYLFDGQMSITDSLGNGEGDKSKYTITATGSILSKKTNTITIKNETDTDAKISFTYSVSNANSFTIDGATASTSGECSTTVGAKLSITIALESKSGFGNPKATLTLTEITYTHMAASSNITFDFDSSLGTVTAGGEVVDSGSTISVDESVIEIVATPVNGAEFVAWVDGNNNFISSDSTYTLKRDDMTVKALFSKDTPYFMVDNTYIFSDLNEAANEAEKNGSTVVLICDGVLPKGDYVIPQGVTLLIPFDDNNTLYTTAPGYVEGYTAPKAYRTLTMTSDAKITVNGAISVSATQSCSQGSHGAPVSAYGHVAMEKGSEITVNNGGNLYAWGYITGSGKITAKSGATVYEYFQVMDWRGGDATSKMINNSQKVFPMSQYYVQNIQVPLTLEAGAVENGYMAVYVTLVGTQVSTIPFIGPDGMFNIINNGSITKDYDEETDRLVIDINNGTLDMKSISLTMNLGLYGNKTINSQSYILPINNNITLNVNSGSTVNITQDIALLPGSKINICEGATCSLSSGKQVFVYGKNDWGNYCGHTNKILMPVKHVVGDRYKRENDELEDAQICVAGTVDASSGCVYITESGANIYGGKGGAIKLGTNANTAVTYQATQSNTDIDYVSIPVTATKLKNADDTYTEPAILEGCCATYVYSGRKWIPEKATNTEYSISDDNILINSSLILDVPSDTQIIIATYDSYERLLDAVCRTPESLEEVSLSGAGVAKIKVFAWDGFDTMSPISGVEEIPLNK